MAKRGALLHDVGKVLTHEHEGTHVQLGVEVATKYGENPLVVNCIAAHHDDVPHESEVSVLVQAADAISGSRPGARREAFETYVKRSRARAHCVELPRRGEVFAIQAGARFAYRHAGRCRRRAHASLSEEIARASRRSCSIRADQGRGHSRDTGGGLCTLSTRHGSGPHALWRTLIDGAAIGRSYARDVARDVARLQALGVVPGLTVVLVGDDPASAVYVRSKGKACEEAGMRRRDDSPARRRTEAELLAQVDRPERRPHVHGILVQMPLPRHMSADKVIRRIRPEKDVDGFHPVNVGKLSIGERDGFVPCTPAGAIELSGPQRCDTRGKDAVIVGRSNIVGKPMAALLMQDAPGGNATVTSATAAPTILRRITRRARHPRRGDREAGDDHGRHDQAGAVVIDVGINRVNDLVREKGYRIVGDVHFASARAVASLITPVPGGVGPMTIAMLMQNTVRAAAQIAGV
jgi:methylenetetrahydrofolate dehydrogenase (NADP+)/methenyltetrahydrofolate cyclohydrolase